MYPSYGDNGLLREESRYAFKYDTTCPVYLDSFEDLLGAGTQPRSVGTRPYEALSYLATQGATDNTVINSNRPTSIITVTDGIADYSDPDADPNAPPVDTVQLIKYAVGNLTALDSDIRFFSAGINAINGGETERYRVDLEALANGIKSHVYMQESSGTTTNGILDFVEGLANLMISNNLICPDLSKLLWK